MINEVFLCIWIERNVLGGSVNLCLFEGWKSGVSLLFMLFCILIFFFG